MYLQDFLKLMQKFTFFRGYNSCSTCNFHLTESKNPKKVFLELSQFTYIFAQIPILENFIAGWKFQFSPILRPKCIKIFLGKNCLYLGHVFYNKDKLLPWFLPMLFHFYLKDKKNSRNYLEKDLQPCTFT